MLKLKRSHLNLKGSKIIFVFLGLDNSIPLNALLVSEYAQPQKYDTLASNEPSIWIAELLENGIQTRLHMGLMTLQNSIKNVVDSEIILNEEANLFLEENKDLNGVVVGVSVTSGNAANSFAFCKEAKKRGATIIVGGPHVSLFYKNILSNRSYVDFCVVANGEDAVKELVSGCPIEDIHNLAYRKDEKIMFHGINGSAEKWSKTKIERTSSDVLRGISAIVSHLGCLWRDLSGGCSFCSSESLSFYKKDPHLVWEEIKQLQDFGAHTIYDRGDYVTADLLKDLSMTKPKNIKIKFNIFTKVTDILDSEFVDCAKNVGVNKIFLGAESGDPKILKKMKKGITVEQTKEAARRILIEGFEPTIGLVVGLLGENQKTLQNTVNLGRDLKSIGVKKIFAGLLIPTPGSSTFRLLKKQRLVDEKSDVFNLDKLSSLWIKNFTDIGNRDIENAFSIING